jgi:hypothetical protein
MDRTFKTNELRNELRNEIRNNFGVWIDGRVWKVVASKSHADAIVKTLVAKGKKAFSFETAQNVTR